MCACLLLLPFSPCLNPYNSRVSCVRMQLQHVMTKVSGSSLSGIPLCRLFPLLSTAEAFSFLWLVHCILGSPRVWGMFVLTLHKMQCSKTMSRKCEAAEAITQIQKSSLIEISALSQFSLTLTSVSYITLMYTETSIKLGFRVLF